eukprot:scaffold178377_cov29-Prasinocladus_malaysianus.AAC.1
MPHCLAVGVCPCGGFCTAVEGLGGPGPHLQAASLGEAAGQRWCEAKPMMKSTNNFKPATFVAVDVVNYGPSYCCCV